jgi:hypothetical protein
MTVSDLIDRLTQIEAIPHVGRNVYMQGVDFVKGEVLEDVLEDVESVYVDEIGDVILSRRVGS